EPADPVGNVARAISEISETVWLGRACVCTARYDTPRKSEIAISPSATSVAAAFRPFGGLKALTPFEIASTPVSADAPEAKARRTTKRPAAPAPAASGCGTVACGQEPTEIGRAHV